MKIKRLVDCYKKSLFRPLMYFKGVVRIHLRFFYLHERLDKGEKIHYFSNNESDSSGSLSSLCSNNENILKKLQSSILGSELFDKFSDNSKLSNNFDSSKHFEYCKENIPSDPDLTSFKDLISKKSQTNNFRPFVASNVLQKMKKTKSQKPLTTENSLAKICCQLPEGKCTDMTSISIIFNSDSLAKSPLASSTTLPKTRCFKKKSIDRQNTLSIPAEYDSKTFAKSQKKKITNAFSNRSKESQCRSSNSTRLNLKKTKTEEFNIIEETLQHENGYISAPKKFSIDRLRVFQSSIENKLHEPTENRQRSARPTSHRNSINTNFLQNIRLNTRAKESKNANEDQEPRPTSRDLYSRKRSNGSKKESNLIGNVKLKEMREMRESLRLNSKIKQDPIRLKKSSSEFDLKAKNRSRSRIEFRNSRDEGRNTKVMTERNKSKTDIPKTTFPMLQKSPPLLKNPIYVNIFAPQLPSARIYLNTQNDDSLQKPDYSSRRSSNSRPKVINFQNVFKEEIPTKKTSFRKSVIFTEFQRQNTLNGKTSQVEISNRRGSQRSISRSRQCSLPSERRTISQQKALPPEPVAIFDSKSKNEKSDVVKQKMMKVFGTMNGFAPKTTKTEKFQLRFSTINHQGDGLKEGRMRK